MREMFQGVRVGGGGEGGAGVLRVYTLVRPPLLVKTNQGEVFIIISGGQSWSKFCCGRGTLT